MSASSFENGSSTSGDMGAMFPAGMDDRAFPVRVFGFCNFDSNRRRGAGTSTLFVEWALIPELLILASSSASLRDKFRRGRPAANLFVVCDSTGNFPGTTLERRTGILRVGSPFLVSLKSV